MGATRHGDADPECGASPTTTRGHNIPAAARSLRCRAPTRRERIRRRKVAATREPAGSRRYKIKQKARRRDALKRAPTGKGEEAEASFGAQKAPNSFISTTYPTLA